MPTVCRALPLLALVVGCRCGPQLTTTEGSLSVEPPVVDFGPVWVGATASRTITVTNRGRASFEVPLSLGGPFLVDGDEVTVPGGAAVELPVRFEPTVAGPAAGELVVDAHRVELRAEGVDPPLCLAPSECRASTFSFTEGRCVEAPIADGVACASDGCLVSPRCVSGQCVGEARSCDDGDACTIDECAAGACDHRPRECRPSTDPCEVARCDSVRGCVTEPAADGTSCGPNDCVTARVCVNGRCKTAVPPEGSECNAASFCQPAGHCELQHCVVPASPRLQPVWRVLATPGWELDAAMGLVGDELGNSWVRECEGACSSTSMALRSFTPAGVERFRVRLQAPAGLATFARRAVSLAQDGVFITVSGGEVVAFDVGTGQRRWAHALAPFFPQEAAVSVRWLVGFSQGRVAVGALSAGPLGVPSKVIALSTADGGTVWEASEAALALEAVADEHDNLFFNTGTELRSLDGAGQLRWATPRGGEMLSVAFGHLANLGEVRDVSTGATEFTLVGVGGVPTCSWANHIGAPLVDGTLYGFSTGACARPNVLYGVWVPQRQLQYPPRPLPPDRFLRVPGVSSAGTFFALLNGFTSTSGDLLGQYSLDGATEVTCELEGPPGLDALMDRGLLVRLSTRQLDAFRVPGLWLARDGWVTSRGDVTRRSRPRF